MKVNLAFNFKGINHEYHMPLWRAGVHAMGWTECPETSSDVTVMWGPNPPFAVTRARSKPVMMIDFPYWNRGGKNRNGKEYYKVSLNGQHPTPFIMKERHTDERYKNTNGPAIMPWRYDGNKIMFAGTGQKAAKQHGHATGGWEAHIIEIIRKQTADPIIYRPKPNQPAPRIPGTIFDDGSISMEEALKDVRCVVCHHGNPTVTALAMGIPIFMNGPIGVASHFASFEFDKINEPIRPEGREQFFYNLSHWQWSVDEIKSGQVFKSFFDRGLLK